MPEHEENHGMPEAWHADCPTKQVKVEIGINPAIIYEAPDPNTITAERIWIEIPTTDVELRINKDGPADINRRAKILFPTEWAGESVVEKINAFEPENGDSNITYARIYFRDNPGDVWELKHHGFISGVGQSHQVGVSKMWVYDYAEFIDQVPITASWDRPTLSSVVTEVITTFNRETPARLVSNVLHIGEDATMDDVAAEDLVYIDDVLGEDVLAAEQDAPGILSYIPDSGHYGPKSKDFYRNRHTLSDVMNWLADHLNAIWYIRPTFAGGQFVIDEAGTQGVLSRKLFVQDTIDEDERVDFDDEGLSRGPDIRVIQNTALYEINPVNTVVVRGEGDTSRSLTSPSTWLSGSEPSGSFPVATVRAEHLYESAQVGSGSEESAELAYFEPIDSNEIEDAIRVAKDIMRELIENEEEGRIRTFGRPEIEPYDVVESHFTCAERFPADIVPIHYEVEEVKHHASGSETYKCEIYVSIFVGENRIIIDQSETGMEDMDSGEFEEIGDDELEEIEDKLD